MFFPLSLLSLLVTPLIIPACSAVPTISHNAHPSARSPHSHSHSLSAHLTSLWDLVTCPSPPGTPSSAPRLAGYTITFTNYTAVPLTGNWNRTGTGSGSDSGLPPPPPPPPIGAATNGDGFMRYTLSNNTTTVGCLEACDAEDKCAFVNAYKDARFGEQAAREGEEAGKHGRGVWTCALYNKCPWGTEGNDNFGQQAEGDDEQGMIKESSGYCLCARGRRAKGMDW